MNSDNSWLVGIVFVWLMLISVFTLSNRCSGVQAVTCSGIPHCCISSPCIYGTLLHAFVALNALNDRILRLTRVLIINPCRAGAAGHAGRHPNHHLRFSQACSFAPKHFCCALLWLALTQSSRLAIILHNFLVALQSIMILNKTAPNIQLPYCELEIGSKVVQLTLTQGA